MTSLETELRRSADAIARAASLAVTCHINPDGDALGSALGFVVAARNAGRDAAVSFGSPFVVGESYRFLPLSLLVNPAEFPAEPDVMVTFDVASADRLGELQTAAARAGELIVVDHHASNPGFGTINLIDPSAAASAQLAYRLILELGWPIDEVVATCLLTGLVTDTGRFQYGNTSAETLRAAADMVEAGARPDQIGRHVYEESPFGFLGVQAAVLEPCSSRIGQVDGLVGAARLGPRAARGRHRGDRSTDRRHQGGTGGRGGCAAQGGGRLGQGQPSLPRLWSM